MRNVILALVAILAVGASTGCAGSQGTSLPTAAPAQTATLLPTVAADEVPRITPQELRAALDSGMRVVVADVRSREAYDEKHIEGAISVPSAELEQRLAELPKSADIALY